MRCSPTFALAELGPVRRAEVHATLARLVADDGEAARHHALAGEREQAHVRALRAAEATDRPGGRAAHLAVAAACAHGAGADELSIRAARALAVAEDWVGVESALDRVSARDPATQGWIALLRARAAWYRGDGEAMRRELEHGLEVTRHTGSEISTRLQVEACFIPIFLECDWETAIADATVALASAREGDVDVPRAEYLLGTAMAQVGRPGWQTHLRGRSRSPAAGGIDVELRAAHNLVARARDERPAPRWRGASPARWSSDRARSGWRTGARLPDVVGQPGLPRG